MKPTIRAPARLLRRIAHDDRDNRWLPQEAKPVASDTQPMATAYNHGPVEAGINQRPIMGPSSGWARTLSPSKILQVSLLRAL